MREAFLKYIAANGNICRARAPPANHELGKQIDTAMTSRRAGFSIAGQVTGSTLFLMFESMFMTIIAK